MFHFFKLFFYAALVGLGVFLYWFIPKYSYVQKNPGFCANLTQHLYYCGSGADLKKTFDTATSAAANVNK